jgi:hypothetical protein
VKSPESKHLAREIFVEPTPKALFAVIIIVIDVTR